MPPSSLFRARIPPLRPRFIQRAPLSRGYVTLPPKPTDEASSDPSPEPLNTPKPEGGPTREQRVEDFKQLLKDWTERTFIGIRHRADDYTAQAATTFAQLGSELNKVTGYGEIDLLKKRVVAQEQRIDAARQAAREAKEEYDKAVVQRANSQREVNDLLQRKHNWTDEDVGRFTSLVRQDHLYEQNEARAKAASALTETEVEREFSELMRVILHRYHEEQIWSDKIRSVSTYGSLTVLGLNLLVFIVAILFVEPWKRRKLAQTFERKVEEMTTATTAAYDERTKELSSRMDKQDETLFDMTRVLHHFAAPTAAILAHEESLSSVEVDAPRLPPTPAGEELGEAHPTTVPVSWLPALYGDDLRWLVLGTSLTATAVGWLARGWYGR
ncbi:hypothetical protein EUX98_g3010 [Antrodiella citrinella]|uniref:Sensitive to high expression protein 9, mitochondrial n=1 Tax=Antrodiella citrinella TaxID=2447956 RepID=A0A4S4MYX9_9APHY|nr:hypothetical protein EUX98_g3010 [Antrodiella citrinella]